MQGLGIGPPSNLGMNANVAGAGLGPMGDMGGF